VIAAKPLQRPASRDVATLSARVAVYGGPCEPPALAEIAEDDPGLLVERVFEAAARRADLPVVAVREVIENLVHAGFRDALVSVLAQGRVVRVSDSGPGIHDPALAMEPGFTTAGEREREVVRGVGCGLPLAASLMHAEGGSLELGSNLSGGTVVTLTAPCPPPADDPEDEPAPCEDARLVMALLLEIGPSRPERLATELGWTVGRCGRELVVLEAKGYIARTEEGVRALTPAGSSLLATLF
jgi:anti-sigma regulatory factor (Ser/Thr protein kinase)